MARAFVSLGSNINPAENTVQAIRALARETRITGVSTVYLTSAEGRPGQPFYYNCIVQIETDMPPLELKHRLLRRIEDALGRERSEDKDADRTIDLDLILYDDVVMATNDLTLPDPDIVRRPFLAVPLQELAPGLILPGYDVPLEKIATSLSRDAMKPLESYTGQIRKEFSDGRKK